MTTKSLDESSMFDRLRSEADLVPPLRIHVVSEPIEHLPKGIKAKPGAVVDLIWNERVFRFAAELTRLSTPRRLEYAIMQASRAAEAKGLQPLVVTPYLSPERLEMLQAEGISGIDLSGNCMVVVPGELLIFRTGQPNAYPASNRIRNVYRGISSMIARLFLLQPRFEAVGDVRREIKLRGGHVSPATVSKVLKSLEEDLVIRRRERTSALIQPDLLLEKLARAFQWPEARQTRQFQRNEKPENLARTLSTAADEAGVRLAITGAASAEQYTVMPREKLLRCYCDNLDRLTEALGDRLIPARRFPDLELLETEDQLAYFDSRVDDGVSFASPIQAWLELLAGDKREREGSEQVRQRLLEDLEAVERTDS